MVLVGNAIGKDARTICCACKGLAKTCGGFIWRYVGDPAPENVDLKRKEPKI